MHRAFPAHCFTGEHKTKQLLPNCLAAVVLGIVPTDSRRFSSIKSVSDADTGSAAFFLVVSGKCFLQLKKRCALRGCVKIALHTLIAARGDISRIFLLLYLCHL